MLYHYIETIALSIMVTYALLSVMQDITVIIGRYVRNMLALRLIGIVVLIAMVIAAFGWIWVIWDMAKKAYNL